MGEPIQARIQRAFAELLAVASVVDRARREVAYHALFDLVYPHTIYPRASRCATKGGPPGGAMAFGRAVRQLGGHRTGEMGKFVYLPESSGVSPTGDEP